MANRIKLIHLSVVGATLDPAVIEFGEKLTVIHGASDTGKSHVFDLIHYAFGLSKSIDIPDEGKGYQYVHLGIEVDGIGSLTLIRDLMGGQIGVVQADVREMTSEPSAEYLDPRHVSKNPNSASRRLLALAGLDGLQVRKNQNNETRMLEWRDVVRLIAVNEESIIAKLSPIESGQHTQRSVEAAIFRLFIEGSDDSGLMPIPKAAELKRISANKVEILDRIVEKLEEELEGSPQIEQLREQLARLNVSLGDASSAVEDLSAKRDEYVAKRAEGRRALVDLRERHDEISSLDARFNLLRAQYDSDISRLEMVAEAADVLALSEGDDCPFCGSLAMHQHWSEAGPKEESPASFAVALAAERAKIFVLRRDLDETIGEIRAEQHRIAESVGLLNEDGRRLTQEIRRMDEEVKLPGQELAPLLGARSEIERQLNSRLRLIELLALKDTTARVERPKTSAEVPIVASDLQYFDSVAEEILRLWSFPSQGAVYYSVADRDLVVGQRLRRVRGKGVRSILHALFNVALAEYCIRRDHRHPGFVVLDSPIVSYRQAGDPETVGEDETIESSVVDAFYAYLQSQFSGQALVLENKSPVSELPPGSREYFFDGGASSSKRAGFYPSGGDETSWLWELP